MTLPLETVLPLQTDLIQTGAPGDLELYIRNLVEALTDNYRLVAQNVNGTINQWSPIAYGLTTPGTGTYDHQIGWYRRAGIMTELWMDVQWTAHTGTGDLAIRVPYLAAMSEFTPWVGVIQSHNNTFSGGYTYLTWNIVQNTTQGNIIQNGSALPNIGIPIAATGRYIGYIQYIGQENEAR